MALARTLPSSRPVVVWTTLIILSTLICWRCVVVAAEINASGDYDYEELASTSGLPGSGSASGSGSSSASGSGSGSGDWWEDDETKFELCNGVIDSNSSSFINSSTNYTFTGCERYGKCNVRDYITLKTENISYVGATVTIMADVNPNASEHHSKLYYKLCYSRLTTYESSELIRCVSNGTTMFSEYTWKKSGKAALTVYVYTSSSYNDSDFLDCDTAKVLVASDYGLNLTVRLYNEPSIPVTNSLLSSESWDNDENSQNDTFITGNMTFHPIAHLDSDYKEAKYYYHYRIHGPFYREKLKTEEPNVTVELLETGRYWFTIDAIAYLDDLEAHHANHSGSFDLLEAVSSTALQVGNNNSVRVGSEEDFVASAEGSTPITFCWYQVELQTKGSSSGGNQEASGPPEPPDGGPPPPPIHPPPPHPPRHRRDSGLVFQTPDESCTVQNDSNSTAVFREKRTFNVIGTFVFVGRFYNQANEVKTNLTIQVVPGPSPVVVASSATAVVIGVTVVVLVVVSVVLFMAVYVPYKKYKNRMTETADFKFVDLSETSSYWHRLKRSSYQALEYFKRRRHTEKIGLVNLGSLPPDDERRRLFYGTNTLTQFAPYETL